IDAAAFEAARAADRLLVEARRQAESIPGRARAWGAPADALEPAPSTGPRVPAAERWAGYFQRLPDQLRDEPLAGLRAAARRVRAAYGPKDSIRDTFAPELTEPLLDATDRLLKAIARYEANRE
ncbi:MAG TPA: hypothetical protein VJ506_04620, partial [Candidatus Limnocylindrales bacterium]|nr:hypothetical protein [Candidatus Limnocylindrales bacterium]